MTAIEEISVIEVDAELILGKFWRVAAATPDAILADRIIQAIAADQGGPRKLSRVERELLQNLAKRAAKLQRRQAA